MLKYHFLNDYDDKYKVKNREIACFSKSKMKDMYPDGNYSIIGETIISNKKDKIDEIVLGKTIFNISKNGSHSKLFYKDTAYICISDGENNSKNGYIKLLKRRWFFIFFLFGLIVANLVAFLILQDVSDIQDTPTPIEPQHEEEPIVEKDIVYITLPAGTVEYHLLNDVNELDGYDISIEMEHDDIFSIIHKQKIKLNKDNTIENGELDFQSLTFELKVGNYQGKLIYTKDDEKFEYPIDIKIRSINSGKMTISYSNEVIVNKGGNQISLDYKHDKNATNDVKLQIVLLDNNQEYVLGESGIVYAGNSISSLSLINSNITLGTYDGYIRLIILSQDGSSTNVTTDIKVHITVE